MRLLDPPGRWIPSTDLTPLGNSPQAVRLELQRLEAAGVIDRDTRQRPHRYRAPEDAPLTEPLVQLVRRTVGVEAMLRRELGSLPGVRAAALFGSWVRGSITPESDVDVLVVTDPHVDMDAMRRVEADVEYASGRTVDMAVFPRDEALDKLRDGSGFLRTLLAAELLPLVGDVRAELGDGP